MQPRPSDNQQRPILPVFDALVPSRSTRSLPRDSVSGARVPVADDLVIGALSRSARIENISRGLSSQAWSTGTVSREVLSSRHSRHWWRVDGRHDSIDDNALFREQGMPAVGVFQEDIDLGLRSLLSTQVDVCPTLPGDCEINEGANVPMTTQSTVLENTLGLLPKVVCGLHEHVSQHVLSALGIDGSMSATAETPAEIEQVGKRCTAPESVDLESASLESGSCLGVEVEFGGRTSNETANPLVASERVHHPAFLHDSHRVTCGPQLFSHLACGAEHLVQHGDVAFHDVSFNRVAASDAHSTCELTRVGTEAGLGKVLDATRLFFVHKVRATRTDGLAVTGVSSGGEDGFSQSGLCCNGSVEFAGLACNGLEEARFKSALGPPKDALGSPEDFGAWGDGNAVVSSDELRNQYWAWPSGRESVRWFVGNLLLIDQGNGGNNAIDVIPAVSELLAIGLHPERTESLALCGAWVSRRYAQNPVDIHRVVLQVHGSELPLHGSWVITAPMESGVIEAPSDHSISVSAAVSTPRFWARVSEFQFVIGLLSVDPAIQVGNVIAFAGSHEVATYVGRFFDDDVHDVYGSTARTLTSIDWVGERRGLASSQSRVSRQSIAMKSTPFEPGLASEYSRWDGVTGATDVVRCDKFAEALSLVEVSCVSGSVSGLTDQGMTDELTHRIRTGPVFLNGVENFRPMTPRYRVSCDSRQGAMGTGMPHVETLDERFLKSWSLAKSFSRQPDQKVSGRDEVVARIAPINVGITNAGGFAAGGSESSMGQLTCGVESWVEQECKERLCRPTIVMRPVESAVTMQAATSFFFRHRARSAWLTEQVSNVVLQHDSQFVRQYLISCDHDAEMQVELGVLESAQASEASVFETSAGWPDRCGSEEPRRFESIVMSVGCTHACTLAHVPQYLNRAAWCRNVTPLLAAASSRMNVAEQFFPPLVSFELPRLVMPVLLSEKDNAVACGTTMIGHMHDLPESLYVRNDSLPEGRKSRCGVRVTLTENCRNESSLAPPAIECPTSPLIRRLRAAESLRSFTDPLRSYLRANWSLSEIFHRSKDQTTATREGGTHFLVMTDRRSPAHLRHRCGVELVTQRIVEPTPFTGMTPAVENLSESVRDARLTDLGTYQNALLRSVNMKVSLAASQNGDYVSDSAEVGDVDACCSVRFPSLVKRAAIGASGNAKDGRATGVVWLPELSNSFAELDSVELNIESVDETVATENLDFSSAPVSVQADVSPLPMTFNRPLKFDDAIARKLDCSVVIYPAEVQTSLNFSETGRQQRCTTSLSDRAA